MLLRNQKGLTLIDTMIIALMMGILIGSVTILDFSELVIKKFGCDILPNYKTNKKKSGL